MPVRPDARRLLSVLAAAALTTSLVACSGESGDGDGSGGFFGGSDGGSGSSAAPAGGGSDDEAGSDAGGDAAPLQVNVDRGEKDVPVSTLIEVSSGGELDSVSVVARGSGEEIAGELSDDGHTWRATDRLEPGTGYRVEAAALVDSETVRSTTRFATQKLRDGQEAFASVAPLAGETVGVGMPVLVFFDAPVADKAEFERHMTVTSAPAQKGAWHWLSDTEAHWRPASYWKPGTEVDVDLDLNGLDAGDGVYGQESREIDFTVGDANIYQVDGRSHQMKVFSDGELLRTLPITLGGPGFTTRSGTKVIMEKWEERSMNSETVGIPAGSPGSYNIDGVQYAMRLTYSGEFIHAAPWSVASQGNANVSHGCTGMSTEDAAWLFAMSKRGDVVEYTGTDRPMTLENGYGDWNLSFADYRQGSALT